MRDDTSVDTPVAAAPRSHRHRSKQSQPLRGRETLGEGLPQRSPAPSRPDRDGRLAYFGPYSEGALCTSANSFIEPILDALGAGRPVQADSNLAAGCFCDWTASE